MTGFLAVFSEPGEQVALEEFHDWYDNEHIPLRLNHLTSFLSGVRYHAADGKQPGWVAMYEIDGVASLYDPSYTALRDNRSERERILVQKLGVLDRRICEVIRDSGEQRSKSTGFRLGSPSNALVTFELSTEPEEGVFDEWARKLRDLHGWVRTRVVKSPDVVVTGIDDVLKAKPVQDYLVITELVSEDDYEAFESSIRTLEVESADIRRWDFYRAYPSIAQSNV
ncbi:hypothetical protein FA15DRAFT_641957 [Coprinopsis marcescibilis]|uniref:EthD domain-containing protein n=1 Tax=Coprinopsis marcescibilis TaxID=230819 RepID=A0A5C3KUE7_COPMA|nr:hypothetical protein FA15DRAFT_641957 [Coprinopsis marcescibilis]